MKKLKRKGHSKINEQIKRNIYAWITRHPQVVQSPISNYYLKVVLDDQSEPQLVPKLLLQVSVSASHTVGTVTSTVPTVTPIGTPELSGVRSGGRCNPN